MYLKIFLNAAVLSLVLITPALASDNIARMDEVIQSYAKSSTFMGAVLVERNGKPEFDKGFGYANIEWQVSNTTDTKFRLASLTKQFTAASVLLLNERGKIDLDAPIKTYIPGAPTAWDKVTIRNLLTHTSGITEFTDLADFDAWSRDPTTPDQTIARFRDKPLDFRPGERWQYSNSNYILLGAIIERVSGRPYAQFVKDNIFTPLGMNESGYDTYEAIIPRRASGYVPTPDGPMNAPYTDMSISYAAGGLYSTTHDLAKWETGLYGGKLLKPESLKAMTTPNLGDYGMGVYIQDGGKKISHSGAIEGFKTQLVYYPDEKLTIVVLANLNGSAPDRIANHLGDLTHGKTVVLPSERPTVAVPLEALNTYVGIYEIRPGAEVTISVEGGQLVATGKDQPKLILIPVSQTRFMVQAIEADFEFFKGADGKIDHLVVYQDDHETLARRK